MGIIEVSLPRVGPTLTARFEPGSALLEERPAADA
jgi:hypothetical protein